MDRRHFLLSTIIFLFFALGWLTVHSQAFDAVSQRFDQQRYEFPQEKIHLTTDRSKYLAGDTIWLRAWVVDAASHSPVQVSEFIYVELVSPNDTVEVRVKLHADKKGVFQGYIPLAPSLPEGIYQLTAHTMFMRSLDKAYFFMKPIEVNAVASIRQRIVATTQRTDSKIIVKLRYEDATSGELTHFSSFLYMLQDGSVIRRGGGDDAMKVTLRGNNASMKTLLVAFDNYSKFIPLPQQSSLSVDFYPEGGYLIPDVENTVTFKMHGTDQWHGEMTGRLIDENGKELANLKVVHDGMGLVKFMPHSGTSYKAIWRDEMNQDVTFDLPAVNAQATVLHVTADEHNATVTAVGPQSQDAIILLQKRGVLLSIGSGSVSLPADVGQPGVVQATLFDSRWRKLSERLFFTYGASQPAISVTPDKASYKSREKVTVDVDLSTLVTTPGNYAVSVTDDQTVDDVAGVNLFTSLLLQSELRGRINCPAYYFQATDSVQLVERRQHLDMLLLTQGWSRYDIPAIMRGRLAEPQSPIEKSMVLTGRVLSEWKKSPVPNATVSLIIPQMGHSDQVKTDSLGQYVFFLPLLPDSVACLVMAENAKGKKQSNLIVDAEIFPVLDYQMQLIDHLDDKKHIVSQAWRMEHSGDWRHILLDEVVVIAIRPKWTADEHDPNALDANLMQRKGIESLEEAINYIPGLTVLNGNAYTAGGQEHDRVSIIVDGERIRDLFGSEEDIIDDLLNVGSTPFDRKNNTHSVFGANNHSHVHYNYSEIATAEGILPFYDIAYIDFIRSSRSGGHGGVLIIRSKPASQRGKKAPSRHLKVFRPLGVQHPAQCYSPRYENGSDCGMAPGTDLRSLLYWNPCVDIDPQGHSRFDFYANDATGTTYTITLETIAPDGQLVRTTTSLSKQ
ncbi:MAG: hypothetical protein J6S96_08870 [Muribaculaceae bacterium]|nr:hypothetical protein [Muribaculaceae bacterium]